MLLRDPDTPRVIATHEADQVHVTTYRETGSFTVPLDPYAETLRRDPQQAFEIGTPA